MTRYTYRCDDHGVFESSAPMSRSAEPSECPACGLVSRRVIAAPSLNLGDGSARRLLDSTARSASEPEVVASLPSQRLGPRQVRNPATLKLPRS